ncbi:MAG: DUF2461 domain-containing protein [Nitrospinota bacterium]
MVSDNKFNGFTKKTITFLRGLEKNNSKEWFDENRDLYDDHLMMPATLYVKEMGEKLKTISPGIVADPRRDKSIFRLNRDVRFGANKKPYKTHLGIYFWDGKGKKLENPGFYFQLDKSKIMFGVGMHIFPREMLNPYRDAVTDPEMGGELKKIITKISKNTGYKHGWTKYKKVPKGYDPDHPNKDYLLYGGIGFMYEEKNPKALFDKKFIDYSFKIFNDMSPLHKWLKKTNCL